MTSLGRGRSQLTFHEDTVVKVASLWEATYVWNHPDTFVTGVSIRPGWESTTPTSDVDLTLLRGAISFDPYVALPEAAPRLKNLWRYRWDGQSYDWRLRLRAHIFRVIATHKLNVSMVTLDNVIRLLPDVEDPVMIHGDPTLANCVWDRAKNGWYWIDPLTRPYIPGDPHVDLGKLFQSCFSYELIITDKSTQHMYHMDLALKLLQLLELDLRPALLWSIIHLVRLIPYQEERHRPIFEQQVKDVWSWI